jgi:hypothetical protein
VSDDQAITLYRNRGAPFTREDGTVIASGEVFVPTDVERKRRAYKLRPAGERAVDARAEYRTARPAAKTVRPGWDRDMSPELYLQLDPNGPYAEDARQALGKADTSDDSPGDELSSRRRDLAPGRSPEEESESDA